MAVGDEDSIGLFGRVGNIVKGVLSNPYVQGAAATTAMGLGPVGILSGGTINAARQAMALGNEFTRKRLEAREQLPEALEMYFSPPPVNPPMGPPVPDEMLPMLEQQVQAKAKADLVDKMMYVEPGTTAAGMMSSMGGTTRYPADVLTLQSMGLPVTMDNIRALNEAQAVGQGMDPSDQLAMYRTMLEIQQMQGQLADEQEEKRQEKVAYENALVDQAGTLIRLDKYLKKGEGSYLIQPGGFVSEHLKGPLNLLSTLTRYMGATDFPDMVDKEINSYAGSGKEGAILVANMLKAMNAQGIPVTRNLQGLMERAAPGKDIPPGLGRSIVREMANILLRDARQNNADLSQYEDSLRALIDTKEFESMDQANDAWAKGLIDEGETVRINGRPWIYDSEDDS